MPASRPLIAARAFDLLLEVDGGVDAQAALAHGLDAVLLDQLVLDVVEEERLAAAGEVARGVDAEPALHRLAGGLGGDHPELGHLGEHLVAARLGLLGRAHRGVGARRLRQAGEQRGLVQLQPLHRLAEVDARGGLRADRGLAAERAERHGVEVLVEDPLLGVLVLELLGELGLADLALVGALLRDVEVAHQLHRDRRAALDGLLVGEVLERRAHDARVVDALVVVVALVLDRDRGVLEGLGDAVALDRAAQLVGLDEAQARAVGGADLGLRAELTRLERVQRRRRGGDRDHVADGGEAGQRDEHQHHHDGEEGLVPRATAAAVTSPVALRPAHAANALSITARTSECSPARDSARRARSLVRRPRAGLLNGALRGTARAARPAAGRARAAAPDRPRSRCARRRA